MTVSTESKTASEKLYLTTAIPFVNARPHLGFALELCIADVLARHARARGRQVHFVTGTDDHSLKNVLAAERDDIPTQRFVAEHGLAFQQLSAALQISHDDFISTSQHPGHHACVEALWHACTEQGDLYRKAYTGLYCVGCERFVDPDETSCAEHPAPLESVTETNWFFRLSRYTELLRAGIERGKLTIIPHGAREETLALLRTTLPDLCVSRSATRARGWGVPVPNDPEQVIWVWFDALAYYLTALGYGSADPHAFTTWWQGHAQRLQVIGKGITRFHALIWPAILSSAGLAWPTDLLVHGYLTHAGAKISKSAGGLDPTPLLEQLGSDAVRYFLLRHVRTTRDGDFSRERFVAAYNAELANGLGNLVQRVLGLTARANAGRVPDADLTVSDLTAITRALPAKVSAAVQTFALDDGLAHIFEVVDAANRFIDRTAPWAAIRAGDLASARQVLRAVLDTLAVLATELTPFLPRTAARLGEALGCHQGGLRDGWQLPDTLHLFPRVER